MKVILNIDVFATCKAWRWNTGCEARYSHVFYKSKSSCISDLLWHFMNNNYAKILSLSQNTSLEKKKKCFHILNLLSSLGIFKCPEYRQGMFEVIENIILESQTRFGLIKSRDEHSVWTWVNNDFTISLSSWNTFLQSEFFTDSSGIWLRHI